MNNDVLKKFFSEELKYNPLIPSEYNVCEQILGMTNYSFWDYGFSSGEFLNPETFSKLEVNFFENGVDFTKSKGLIKLCCDSFSEATEGIVTSAFGTGRNLFLKLDEDAWVYEVTVDPKNRLPSGLDYHEGIRGFCKSCKDSVFSRLKDEGVLQEVYVNSRRGDFGVDDVSLDFQVYRKVVPSVDYNPN